MLSNKLFSEVTSEESATVSGGVAVVGFSLDKYIFGLGAAYLLGNPGITADEQQFVWQNSLYGVDPSFAGIPKF